MNISANYESVCRRRQVELAQESDSSLIDCEGDDSDSFYRLKCEECDEWILCDEDKDKIEAHKQRENSLNQIAEKWCFHVG
mmetsp:Transcript_5238/g.19615  ORF Transcript_5238/g.19615 Transcript_5238/m.19615 type:complete len:81 (-) Transcript_5238:304-546(-)